MNCLNDKENYNFKPSPHIRFPMRANIGKNHAHAHFYSVTQTNDEFDHRMGPSISSCHLGVRITYVKSALRVSVW